MARRRVRHAGRGRCGSGKATAACRNLHIKHYIIRNLHIKHRIIVLRNICEVSLLVFSALYAKQGQGIRRAAAAAAQRQPRTIRRPRPLLLGITLPEHTCATTSQLWPCTFSKVLALSWQHVWNHWDALCALPCVRVRTIGSYYSSSSTMICALNIPCVTPNIVRLESLSS